MIQLPNALRALRHRNFRLYFTGHCISTLGTWIQQVALAWLVYRLTGSAALLGVTTCAALLPQLLVGPFAGAWIDRHDKRRLLIVVEGLLGLQALSLAALTASGMIGPTLLVAMAALLGVLNAVDTPLRQSLLSQFVDDRADLPNALALNAMLFTLSRFIGPPLAGLLLGFVSEAVLRPQRRVLPGVDDRAAVGAHGADAKGGGPVPQRLRRGAGIRATRPEDPPDDPQRIGPEPHRVELRGAAAGVRQGHLRRRRHHPRLALGAAGAGSLLSSIVLASHSGGSALSRLILLSSAACSLAMLVFAWSSHLPRRWRPWRCSASASPAATSAPTSSCRAAPRRPCAAVSWRSTPPPASASTPWAASLPACSPRTSARRRYWPWGTLLLGYCLWLARYQRRNTA